jgi:hypothetical protein
MVFSLAVSWADVGVWLLTIAGMAAIAVFAWKLLQRQEDRDPAFLRKLDDDDARARGE